MSKTITLRPRLNEKTYGLAEQRVYVFDVERSVNKHSIARAVEAQFNVKVTEVNTLNISGKPKRVMSLNGKRYTNMEGNRNDFKKAYVTLAEGNALPFFEAVEAEEEKEEKLQGKLDQAAAKKAAKDEKKVAKAAKKQVEPETPKVEEPKARRGWRLPKKNKKPEEGAK